MMSSPFPGIDPYLESQNLWPDFHHDFITALRRAMNAQIASPYVARIDERMNLVELSKDAVKTVFPHVAVVRQRPGQAATAPARGVLTLEPVTIPLKLLEEF